MRLVSLFPWIVQGKSPMSEDAILVSKKRSAFVIADGFGGGPGKKSADLAVKSVMEFIEKEAGDFEATLPFEVRPYYSMAGNILLNAVALANEKIKTVSGGGCSLVAGYLDRDKMAIAQVGALACWLQRDDQRNLIASPQTLERERNPFLQEDHPLQAIPLMTLGTQAHLEPRIIEFNVLPFDRLWVQTPGVTPEMRDLALRGCYQGEKDWLAFQGQDLLTNAAFLGMEISL